MKKWFIIIFAALSSLPSYGQDNLNTKWILSIDFGIQEHDKRLFDYSEKELLLELHPETFGTYQLGIRADRRMFYKGKFEFFGGIGIGSELNTFTRPFDHFYKRDFPQILILPHTNRYYKNLIQLPITSKFRFGGQFGFSMELLPQFSFLTIADNSENSPLGSISWWGFDFYSVELNPSFTLSTDKFDFGLKYRVFQIKKIDKILFNHIIKDPRTDQTFETENPFKLWLSIGYKF